MRLYKMAKHLLLYDGECALCHYAVRFVLFFDSKATFAFAPLKGMSAARYTKGKTLPDSLVLVENFQTQPKLLIEGQGALRICWHLGGWWRWIGILSFLPGWLSNWAYRLIARYRYKVFGKVPTGWQDAHLKKKRFLD